MVGFSLSETVEPWLDSLYQRLRKHGWILFFTDCGNRLDSPYQRLLKTGWILSITHCVNMAGFSQAETA
jgi:hypothetical protein